MRIIYKLEEEDIKKILADHFDALPEEVSICNETFTAGMVGEQKIITRIEINTIQE